MRSHPARPLHAISPLHLHARDLHALPNQHALTQSHATQGAAKARQEAPAADGALYIDRDGNAHLGVRAGDDRELFTAMRQMQVGGGRLLQQVQG